MDGVDAWVLGPHSSTAAASSHGANVWILSCYAMVMRRFLPCYGSSCNCTIMPGRLLGRKFEAGHTIQAWCTAACMHSFFGSLACNFENLR